MNISPNPNENNNINQISIEGKKFFDIQNNALSNIEKFWEEQAKNLLWFKKWEKPLEWNPPFAQWFKDGKINASINCIDRHINSNTKNKAAIIWENENGQNTTLTYYQLYHKINQFANALKNIGIKKGDRVTIYLPTIPELVISMLACSRIGAIHNVVFSGFSSKALADRINDAQSKLIITVDANYRRGKLLELKKIVDQAILSTPSIKNVIILRKTSNQIHLDSRDLWWDDVVKNEPLYCEPEYVDSTHPLFILYTSGTTGKPKGVVHSTGGYLTHLYATAKWVFNFNKKDVYFCTADIGWITGHSYIVYAPLMHGVTEVIYDGTPDYPKNDRYWSLVEKYGVTILYTTPTALRIYIKYGNEIPNSYNLSTLRLLGTVGEPINPKVWIWYFENIGKKKCPIIDTWWQTETGGIMISHCNGIETFTMKPGSAMFPIPGIDVSIVGETGETLKQNNKGYLVIRKPWPGMLMTLWNEDEKYKNYWREFDTGYYYYAGDYAIIDEDSYFWLLGRSDDVLKISGHRLGTIELESAIVSHNVVAEAAVTSKPDYRKGESIAAFVVLKTVYIKNNEKKLQQEIIDHIRKNLGPIATPDKIYFVNKLPKTRSGKIMRRLLKSIITGQNIGDTTTLEDGTSIEEIQKTFAQLNSELNK
ncbi:MAG: acetate--CoA ligase [Nitrososphaeraceae archaeon]